MRFFTLLTTLSLVTGCGSTSLPTARPSDSALAAKITAENSLLSQLLPINSNLMAYLMAVDGLRTRKAEGCGVERFRLEPGSHTLTIQAERSIGYTTMLGTATLTLQAEAARIYTFKANSMHDGLAVVVIQEVANGTEREVTRATMPFY